MGSLRIVPFGEDHIECNVDNKGEIVDCALEEGLWYHAHININNRGAIRGAPLM